MDLLTIAKKIADHPPGATLKPGPLNSGLCRRRNHEDALRRAQQRGDLAPGKDPAALAGFFVTFMNGLRVAAKTNPDERTLIQRMEAALTVLD